MMSGFELFFTVLMSLTGIVYFIYLLKERYKERKKRITEREQHFLNLETENEKIKNRLNFYIDVYNEQENIIKNQKAKIKMLIKAGNRLKKELSQRTI